MNVVRCLHVQSNSRSILRFLTTSKCLPSDTKLSDGEIYDVIISGGGMIGASMACALGKIKGIAI